jgi:protein-L-isoaspartate(D-aspartate) O-methyltransferase
MTARFDPKSFFSRNKTPPSGVSNEDREADFERLRNLMVERQLEGRDIVEPRVLRAMREVPRHRFVPAELARRAYEDNPLPIGARQFISQPYIVALMSQMLAPEPGDKILEIGAGSGYQAAVLAAMGARVFSVEIIESLAERARVTLAECGCETVQVRTDDGYWGWFEEAPFDGIILTAAPHWAPRSLKDQMKDGARMVLPVGKQRQQLILVTRDGDSFAEKKVLDVRFVPMTGEIDGHSEDSKPF